ncbi:MAG: helix-turn-helix domain-containing protein [Actinomycetota bacterium]
MREPVPPGSSPENDEVAFLTVGDAARRLHVSTMTVYRLIKSGRLEAARVGRMYRVPANAVERYLRQRYRDTG